MPPGADHRGRPPVGRFAPSPTGPLHLGSLVAAVGSWLFARSAGGRWLLRMEDLDTPRVVPGCADDILRTLEALGLFWDGEVMFQSMRTEAYLAVLEGLQERGLVYPCGCSRADIARVASAPSPETGEVPYPGTCRNGLPEGKEPRAFRLRVDKAQIAFIDGIMGEYDQELAAACGDFVVRRADGPFAYHLAVVVDDEACGVTQVVRGADLLASTPRQIYLHRLLGHPVPAYCHLPLVTGHHGGKLSKRDNALSLAAGVDLGRDAGRLIAAALVFLGQHPPHDMATAPPAELLRWGADRFDPAAIPRRSAPLSLSD